MQYDENIVHWANHHGSTGIDVVRGEQHDRSDDERGGWRDRDRGCSWRAGWITSGEATCAL